MTSLPIHADNFAAMTDRARQLLIAQFESRPVGPRSATGPETSPDPEQTDMDFPTEQESECLICKKKMDREEVEAAEELFGDTLCSNECYMFHRDDAGADVAYDDSVER